ncbi:hypothetical protein HanIR_Chr17g0899141 [Helianthus annuus]|nr:hypothetical protein HanIR_Chr17g0899141 [Helianthus annuus]
MLAIEPIEVLMFTFVVMGNLSRISNIICIRLSQMMIMSEIKKHNILVINIKWISSENL